MLFTAEVAFEIVIEVEFEIVIEVELETVIEVELEIVIEFELEIVIEFELEIVIEVEMSFGHGSFSGGVMNGSHGPGNGGVEAPDSGASGKRYNHHRLDVYRATIEFIAWQTNGLPRLPRRSNIADQLGRACTSIALNIAEACGESSPAERMRFFRIARRSATECDAALDVIEAMKIESPQRLEPGRLLIGRIIAMLTALAPESRRSRPPRSGR